MLVLATEGYEMIKDDLEFHNVEELIPLGGGGLDYHACLFR
jgi:hypothetical protein